MDRLALRSAWRKFVIADYLAVDYLADDFELPLGEVFHFYLNRFKVCLGV